jgi:hypothetical protein
MAYGGEPDGGSVLVGGRVCPGGGGRVLAWLLPVAISALPWMTPMASPVSGRLWLRA